MEQFRELLKEAYEVVFVFDKEADVDDVTMVLNTDYEFDENEWEMYKRGGSGRKSEFVISSFEKNATKAIEKIIKEHGFKVKVEK